MTLRVGFAGTPAFAATALEAILGAGFTVPLVLTRADRPRGRGMKLEPSAVKAVALARGLPVFQPASLKTPEARAEVVAVPLDVLVVAAYGLILPPAVLAWPRYGCLNVHASRLPRWRGAAPIQRAILAGDVSSGVTIMQMDAGLDTGPMIETVDVPLAADETAGSLHDRLASAGAAAIVRVLGRLAREGALAAEPQPVEGVTYAHKLERSEAAIDWTEDVAAIDRRVRAFAPVPGAVTMLAGEPFKIHSASPLSAERVSAGPGTVLAARAEGIDVACGAGVLRITGLQPAGRPRMTAAAFLAGHALPAGSRFAGPAGAAT